MRGFSLCCCARIGVQNKSPNATAGKMEHSLFWFSMISPWG
jgi:hypothetical protein